MKNARPDALRGVALTPVDAGFGGTSDGEHVLADIDADDPALAAHPRAGAAGHDAGAAGHVQHPLAGTGLEAVEDHVDPGDEERWDDAGVVDLSEALLREERNGHGHTSI